MIEKDGAMKEAKAIFLISRDSHHFRKIFWEHIPPGFNVILVDTRETDEEEIIEQMSDADILFALVANVPEMALRKAKNLKFIHLTTQGYDYFPTDLASELGIPVANIGGATTVPVAEHSVLLMLAVLRNICPNIALHKAGNSRILDARLSHQLYKKVVGIIGFGNIGSRVGKLVHGFDAEVVFHDIAEISPSLVERAQARQVSYEELLGIADIVSLHVPLDDSTRRMVGREQLRMMKPSAILINTSRGKVVDEEALIRALQEKEIAGAGLDVLAKEPPDLDNPLLSMDNVVTTPHMAGLAWEDLPTVFNDIWGNVKDVCAGKPARNVVNNPKQDGS